MSVGACILCVGVPDFSQWVCDDAADRHFPRSRAVRRGLGGGQRRRSDQPLWRLIRHACITISKDVGPLRRHLEASSLGEGYPEFLIATDHLMLCEPALDRTKINPMLLEAWNFVYDTAKLKVRSPSVCWFACGGG
jgi:hypothetical protein